MIAKIFKAQRHKAHKEKAINLCALCAFVVKFGCACRSRSQSRVKRKCEKNFFCSHLRRWFIGTMICMAIPSLNALAQTQDQCAAELAEAEQKYKLGQSQQAIAAVRRCLDKNDLTQADKIQAYRLLALAHIVDDSLNQARQALMNLLEIAPDYQPDPDARPTFIKLVAEVKQQMPQRPQEPVASLKPKNAIKNEFVLGYGLALPMSPEHFWSRYRVGFNLTGGVGFRVNRRWTIGGEIAYSRLGQKVESSNTGITHGDGAALVEMLAVVRFHFNRIRGSTQFYILGGAGANFVKLAAVTERLFSGLISPRSAAAERQTGAMAAAGVGLKFAINARTVIFVESRCNLIFVANDDLIYLPLKTGVIF
jgi:tetratricopeptide (TPR) repeat protein